jgi:hypothetical protein
MRREEKMMRRKQGKKSAFILGLLALGAFVLTFQLGAVAALAGNDDDSDGFLKTVEDSEITLPQGMTLAAYPGVSSLPKCAAGIPRDQCVDPTKQDLFVIIQRANGVCPPPGNCSDTTCGPFLFGNSNIPLPSQYANTYNPLALVYPGFGSMTLGVTTHELIRTSGTSQIIGPAPPGGGWYAVRIVENLNPCSNYMGLAKFGFPSSSSLATVWPEKIKNWINDKCREACFDLDGDGADETCYTPTTTSGTFTCKNANSATSIDMKAANPELRPLYYEFLQNVISHEASHMMKLASGSSTSADHHYSTLTGVLMERSVLATATKDVNDNITITLYISKTYTNQDKTQHKLK